jgi:hypothetical protein
MYYSMSSDDYLYRMLESYAGHYTANVKGKEKGKITC